MEVTSTHDDRWGLCLRIIANNVTPQQYQTWFKPIGYAGYDEQAHQVTLVVPSIFFMDWLEEHYIRLLAAVLKRVFGEGVELQYRVVEDRTNDIKVDMVSRPEPVVDAQVRVRTVNAAVPAAEEAQFDSQLQTCYTFENFVEGASNKMPRSVACSLAENPRQQTFNPLFIYGHSGVGKTHLATAIGLRCKQKYPHMRVLYVSAYLMSQQYVDAYKENKINDFMHFYQTIDMLIVDDIQEFQGMKGSLNAFFHIFNHLRLNGKQIILTCDRPPVELQAIEERMLTRFKWGLQCEIEMPNEQLRYDILRAKLRRNGLTISDEVVRYIARHVGESVRDLEGVINSLMTQSILLGRDIDMAMAEDVVRKTVRTSREPVTIERIMRSVCDEFGVSEQEVQSGSRKANIVRARQMVMYYASKLTDMGSARIGQFVGRRSHATVLHSISQAETLIESDETMRDKAESLRRALAGRI